jgi:hypothetical protein
MSDTCVCVWVGGVGWVGGGGGSEWESCTHVGCVRVRVGGGGIGGGGGGGAGESGTVSGLLQLCCSCGCISSAVAAAAACASDSGVLGAGESGRVVQNTPATYQTNLGCCNLIWLLTNLIWQWKEACYLCSLPPPRTSRERSHTAYICVLIPPIHVSSYCYICVLVLSMCVS